ncbi:RNA/RNP complex-1-interacting phosphatase isoform X2 [Clinocottus analis]|uniref:RNA/RNP complex-1-interacting phosphatase isoform X2 n=1 Tax=Clinocottus analis TaxID=304258 RepID=UPI0035BF097A
MSWPSKKGGVPLRWLDYSAVGKRLEGTRFIAFKVPLKQALNRQLPGADGFGPWDLLDSVNRENQELGLIIDLTFTKRYYSLQDVPESLLVMKIFTAGHVVPCNKTILSFKRAVHSFLRDNAENDKLIGVHCTHGLNRTGYLMCRYLIDVDGMDPKEAIELFNSSRGHAVERQNYLDDLQFGPKRSNKGMETAEQEPMRGLASQRPSSTPSDSDRREDRRPHSTDTQKQRPFPSRRTNQNQRSHPHHPHDGLPSPPPEDSRSWYAPPEDSRSRYAPPEDSRSRYAPPEDSRSRYAPPEDSRSRYAPPEDSRSRYPPPEDSRSRYPPPEESRSWYLPPEESRSWYPPPEDSRSRYPPPEDSRSRYPPPEERSRYPPPEDSRSWYPPPEERSRYPPPEERSRYPPPKGRRSKHPPPEEKSRHPPPERRRSTFAPPETRRICPPPLPRYTPHWAKDSIG